MQRGRAAISARASSRRTLDEADRIHAAGYRRVSAAGKYQPGFDAVPASARCAKTDDSATGFAGDHVAEGVSGHSQETRKWQRAGVARISNAVEDVPADLEFVPDELSGQTRAR